MKKIFRFLTAAAAVFSSVILSLTVYAGRIIPDSISTVENDIVIRSLYYGSMGEQAVAAVSGGSQAAPGDPVDVDFSMFGVFPVKTVSVTKTERSYVVPSGNIIGIRLQASGVMIVAMEAFESEGGLVSPAADAGLLKGDVICSVNGKSITDNVSLTTAIDETQGKTAAFTVLRSGTHITVNVTPARAVSSGKYKCGLWVRDSAAGIGTLTFYCPDTGIFAGLGHSVTDADTGLPVPLSGGELLSAGIIGIKKGSSGTAGELSGVLGSEILGELILNDGSGVYGRLKNIPQGDPVPLACCTEVHTGSAQILASIDSNGPKLYDAEIISIAPDLETPEKNFVIEVTDTALLSSAGGIVQGMSGSPIIQDGMLAGAVTHVFLNDPKRGYGIFAEHMFDSALIASRTADYIEVPELAA